METFELGLVLLAAVLLSSVVDQLVPKVSSQLIQIGLGVLLAVFVVSPVEMVIDPELFLVLFVAPLLFDEAKNIDKRALWKNRRSIMSLAIGLVVAAALIVGFYVNWLIPSIPLAAAFALGAALGPTDAVAVASLSEKSHIPLRQKNVLEGESLINDASGIVSFQFAIAAATTGAFSLLDASASFAVSFFGGIILGIVLGFLGNFLVKRIRSWGLENTTFHVLFEVLVPFIVYLIANRLGVSGVLAVVAAGLIGIISSRSMAPQTSRMNIVSTSVWKVLSFALNGTVFVLLGAQLPRAMESSWSNMLISNFDLILYILSLTAILYGIRFAWLFVTHLIETGAKPRQALRQASLRSVLTMTLFGARGAITLALVFTLPIYDGTGNAFPQRDLILFLAAGVILCSLLIATFIVPLLVRDTPDERDPDCPSPTEETAIAIDILRGVIEELSARQTPETRRATQLVVRSYNARIARLKASNDIETEPNNELRIKALRWEQDCILALVEAGEIDPVIGYQQINRFARIQSLVKHHNDSRWVYRNALRHIGLILRSLWHRITRALPTPTANEAAEVARELQITSGEYAISRLKEEMSSPDAPTEDVSELILEYQRVLMALRSPRPAQPSQKIFQSEGSAAIARLGLLIELEQIQSMYETDKLCRSTAKRLRENVHLMQIDLENHI